MVKISIRSSSRRGYADYGWLKSHHTFSFANYYDPEFTKFGSLQVINEDLVQAKYGFGTHPHKEMEIFTYMVSGHLTHEDSMSNTETVSRGQVQFTTAGTGIRHSEMNEHQSAQAHLLQIWVNPSQKKLPPSYETLTYDENLRVNELLPLISPGTRTERELENTIGIHADFYMSTCYLHPGKAVRFKLQGKDPKSRKGYIHFVNIKNNAELNINKTHSLKPGDGAFLTEFSDSELPQVEIFNQGEHAAEFIIMELS